MGPAGVTDKKKTILLISVANQLTYPEFHFETETKIDSLTGVQQYKGNYVLNACLQYSHTFVNLGVK